MNILDVSGLQDQLAGVLVDTVRITKPGKKTFDKKTGKYATSEETLIYEGAGSVIPTAGVTDETTGKLDKTDNAYRLLLPVSTEGIQPGLLVTVTETGTVKPDPEITKRSWAVKHLAMVTSFPVFKIVELEEVTK